MGKGEMRTYENRARKKGWNIPPSGAPVINGDKWLVRSPAGFYETFSDKESAVGHAKKGNESWAEGKRKITIHKK